MPPSTLRIRISYFKAMIKRDLIRSVAIVLLCCVANVLFADELRGESIERIDDNAALREPMAFKVLAPDSVEVGSTFRIEFTINRELDSSDSFKVPSLEMFNILAGPSVSTSTSVSIVNGVCKKSQSVSYSYLLKAIQVGDYEIDSASVLVRGKKVESLPITITVNPERVCVEACKRDRLEVLTPKAVKVGEVFTVQFIFDGDEDGWLFDTFKELELVILLNVMKKNWVLLNLCIIQHLWN